MRISLFPEEGQQILGECCLFCNKIFESKFSTLNTHLNDNTCLFLNNGRNAKNWSETVMYLGVPHFSCPLCINPEPIVNHTDYTVHRLLCHKDYKVVCQICDAEIEIGSLRTHVMGHFNKFLLNGILECDICHKLLAPLEFLEHISTLHGKGPKRKLSRPTIASFFPRNPACRVSKYLGMIGLVYLRNHDLPNSYE